MVLTMAQALESRGWIAAWRRGSLSRVGPCQSWLIGGVDMMSRGAMFFAISLFATSAHSETFTRVVVAGGTLQLALFNALNADCSSMGYTSLRVTNAPQHGTVTTRKGKGYPNYGAGPLRDCNMRKVDGVLAYYTPEPGFTGTDYFTIDAIFANGNERIEDFQITVK
jgi:hypothetical protein